MGVKNNQLLFRAWDDTFYRTTKCDKCRVLLITSTYTHNTQEFRVAWSTSKSHSKGWLCHVCATKKPTSRHSAREKAFSTYEQLDNYLISRIKQEKELWFGKKKDKTCKYHSVNDGLE